MDRSEVLPIHQPGFQILEWRCDWCGCLSTLWLPRHGKRVLHCERIGCGVAIGEADGDTQDIRFFLMLDKGKRYRLMSVGEF